MRILLIVVLLASMASFPVGVRNKQKSNILWIITDEHNFNTLGCFRELLSPNQAENGAVANRMDSSSPVFSPCRFESTLNPLALNDVKKCFLILWEDGLCVNVKFISKFQHQ